MSGPTFNGTRVGKLPIGITIAPFSKRLKEIYSTSDYKKLYGDVDIVGLEKLLISITTEAVNQWNTLLERQVFEFQKPVEPKPNSPEVSDCGVMKNNVIIYPAIIPAEIFKLGGTFMYYIDENGKSFNSKLMQTSQPIDNPSLVNCGTIRMNFSALEKKVSKIITASEIFKLKAYIEHLKKQTEDSGEKFDITKYDIASEDDIEATVIKNVGKDDIVINQFNYLFSITHELGHVLGLDHTIDMNSIMYHGLNHRVAKSMSENKWKIGKSDIAAIVALYQMKKMTV
ncbi:matrixin family metalloprotease [Marininema halotolerans]|uniref:Matrixin n=1 Tax=Marininema halotolerans TaxID=1155944 RepID=A0A1I6U3Y4_9BACL|nr:matrixin family metalloprotease [Marininema halotolerans]SFS96173.1 Matrixin [Marininema halotolerans]